MGLENSQSEPPDFDEIFAVLAEWEAHLQQIDFDFSDAAENDNKVDGEEVRS